MKELYNLNEKNVKYIAITQLAVNEFLQKRDLLYNFVQKEESTLVKFEPLIKSAIQKMGLTFNPQQKVRDNLYVDKDNWFHPKLS